MRLSTLVRAGSQILPPNCVRNSSCQHIRSSPQWHTAICGDHAQICVRNWESGIHTNCKDDCSLLQKWALRQQFWALKEQKRWALGTPTRQAGGNAKSKVEAVETVVYRGPLSDTLKKVKMLSFTTCVLSVLTGPVITFYTSPQLSVILKGAVGATVMLLSASTTAALHWFAGPYVHSVTWKPGDPEIKVEIITWMATRATRTIQISDIRPAKTNRPFVSFAVKDKFYYVDTDLISNKDLLRMLTFYQKQK